MATPPRPSIRPVPISPSLDLKPPRQGFEAPARKTTFVDIRHPGYPDGRNTLLLLPAYDSNGFHHVTARIACAILANNSWDGYFSLTRDGPVVTLGNDDILVSDTPYYFVVPTGKLSFLHKPDEKTNRTYRRKLRHCPLLRALLIPLHTAISLACSLSSAHRAVWN
jgi:hypothetical protein